MIGIAIGTPIAVSCVRFGNFDAGIGMALGFRRIFVIAAAVAAKG